MPGQPENIIIVSKSNFLLVYEKSFDIRYLNLQIHLCFILLVINDSLQKVFFFSERVTDSQLITPIFVFIFYFIDTSLFYVAMTL